jgi:hypothetical protein
MIHQLNEEFNRLLENQNVVMRAMFENFLKKLPQQQVISIPEEEEPEETPVNAKRSLEQFFEKADVDDDEEEEEFIVDDDSDISSYRSSEMEVMVAEHNEKQLQHSKRVPKKVKAFIDEEFKDDHDKGIDCGSYVPTRVDAKELEDLVRSCQNIHSLQDFARIVENNGWWIKHFGSIVEGVISNCGRDSKKSVARSFYSKMVSDILVFKKDVRVQTSIYQRPKAKCGLCGHARKCDYDYLANDEKEIPVGNNCYHITQNMVELLTMLRSPRTNALEGMFEVKDRLQEAHENKTKVLF